MYKRGVLLAAVLFGMLMINLGYAANCGDGVGVCSCGDTVTASVVLGGSHLVTSAQCNGTALTLGAHNILIDGNSTTIMGNGTGYGVYDAGYNNITIKNFAGISNFSNGAYISSAGNVTIFNNSISPANDSAVNGGIGIYLASSAGGNVSNNNITTLSSVSNGGYGVYFAGTSDNGFISSNLVEAYDSIPVIINSENSTIIANTLYAFADANVETLRITAGNSSVSSNYLEGKGVRILLISSSGNLIEDNTIMSNHTSSTAIAVDIGSSAGNNTFDNNTIISYSTTGRGISINYGDNNFSDTNITMFSSNAYGIYLSSGSGNTFTNGLIDLRSGGDAVRIVNGAATFTNVSFNRSAVSFGGTGGSLTARWYLDVAVQNGSGTALQNANVTITNSSSGQVSSSLTNASGNIPKQILTEFWRNITDTVYSTPHTVTTRLEGYSTDATVINLTQTNSTVLTVSLNPALCGSHNASIVLGQNISSNGTCFIVAADNIIIDGNGYTITGNGSGYGIDNSGGFDNITIKNFAGMNNFTNAVYAGGMTGSTIFNNNITAANTTFGYGLFLTTNSTQNNISGNIINTTGELGHAIYLNGSSDNATILSNDIDVQGINSVGVYMVSSGNALIQSNTITAYRTGMDIRGSGNTILQNVVNFSKYLGIMLYTGSDNNLIDSNNITMLNNTADHSIYLVGADNNTVTNNRLAGRAVAKGVVRLYLGSDNNNITSNTIDSTGVSDYGIHIESSSNNNSLGYNKITTNSGEGIFIDGSNYASVDYNNISTSFNPGTGIRLANTSGDIVDNNMIVTRDTNSKGMSLDGVNDTNFTGNFINVSGNGAQGIYFYSSSYGNNFNSNNITVAYSEGIVLRDTHNTQFNGDMITTNNNLSFLIYQGSSGTIISNAALNSGPNLSASSISNVSIQVDDSPPADPSGKLNISDYLIITNVSGGASISFNLSYTDSDITDINENTLAVYRYNSSSSSWEIVSSSGVDVASNIVYSGTVSSFSTFAPFGDPHTGCGTINSSVTLSKNISVNGTCFTINASNIVLDGGGYTITGNNSGSGAGISGFSNVTVKNIHIINFTNGIVSLQGSNNTILNNVISTTVNGGMQAEGTGILISNSSDNNVSNNTVTTSGAGFGAYGILVYNAASRNYIMDNNITTTGSSSNGILIYQYSTSNQINGNTVITSSSLADGISVQVSSTGNVLSLNTINTTGNNAEGIYIGSSELNIISSNDIYTSNNDSQGIELSASNYVNITSNNITTRMNLSEGVFLSSSNFSRISLNVINTSEFDAHGMEIAASTDLVIENNTLTMNGSSAKGMLIRQQSTGNRIRYNSITHTSGSGDARGIVISEQSDNINLTGNTFSLIGSLAEISVDNTTETLLLDQAINDYLFTNAGIIIRDSSNGEIKFLNTNITQSGANLSADIRIGVNSIFLNSTNAPGLNTTANITIYNTDSLGITYRVPFRDSAACPASICTEISDADRYIFNVTHFTTYSVGEGNNLPNISAITILPATAYTNSSLSVNVMYSDQDSDNGTVYFNWTVNDVQARYTNFTDVVTAQTVNDTLSSSNFNKTDNITVYVWAYDGTNNSVTRNSSITISNTLPEITAPVFSPVSPQADQDVTASVNYTDIDTDNGTVYFRWYKNSASIYNDTGYNISSGNSTSSTLSSGNYSAGDNVSVSVFAFDGDGNSTARNSSVIISSVPSGDSESTSGESASGGGGSYIAREYDITDEIESAGSATKRMIARDVVKYIFKGESHEIELAGVDFVLRQATLEIRSAPRRYTIKEGEDMGVDLDENGYNDTKITLVSLGSVSTFTIEAVKEEIPAPAAEGKDAGLSCAECQGCSEWSECREGVHRRVCYGCSNETSYSCVPYNDSERCISEEEAGIAKEGGLLRQFLVLAVVAIGAAAAAYLFIRGWRKK